MKNKMDDLRNHLFEQMERLRDADPEQGDLDREVTRSKAINDIAGKLIESAKAETQYLEVTCQDKGSEFLEGRPRQATLTDLKSRQ